ncbi:MAG: hypothetical protein AB1942_20705 [Pseudomonadota bacterium]
MRLAAALAAVALVAAPVSAAGTAANDEVAACAVASDRAMCLLRIAVDRDGGSALWRERELREQPALLASLGVTAHGVAAARGANPSERIFFAAMDEGKAAADEARALDRAGRGPADALAPILALTTASPPVPPFFAGQGDLSSPRAEAYQQLLASGEALRDPPGATLATAAADAWERDIRDPAAPRTFRSSAAGLALARLGLRDEAGADRALTLIDSPFVRIGLLADLGRLDAAVAAALALDRDAAFEGIRAEMTAALERAVRANAAAARAAAESLPDELRRMGLADDPAVAREMSRIAAEQRRAAQAPPQVPRIPRAEVSAELDDRIGQMQDHILRTALRTQRPETVRPLADRLLRDARIAENRYRFPLVLRTATPATATARLDALEATLSPTRGAELFEPLMQAWVQVGRPDRAGQLLERAAGWARQGARARPSLYAESAARLLWSRGRQAEAGAIASLSPVDKLELDIAAGRGLAGFDAYLAEADESQRNSLVVHCTHAATTARAWAVVVECSERRRRIYTGAQQRYAHADMAMEAAARAADADELPAARRLFAIATESRAAAMAAEPQTSAWPDPFTTPRLLAVAKAELRADGRLPKSQPPPRP